MSRASSAAVPFVPEKGAAVRRAAAAAGGGRLKAFAIAALRMLGAMALSAAVALGAIEAWGWCTRSPLFDARAVRVHGAAHATRDELLLRSGLKAGQNLFRADLAAAARGVESSPWVVSASVSRSLPPAFDVEVVEHRPAARAQLGPVYVVDAEGRVFKRSEEGDPADVRALPLVTGISREEWARQREPAQLKLLAALQLVDAWAGEGLPAAQLVEVRADPAGGFTALAAEAPGERPQEIRVGAGPFRAKLKRLAQVRAALQRRGEKAARIDLDNQARPDWVAAQIVNDTGAPPRRP